MGVLAASKLVFFQVPNTKKVETRMWFFLALNLQNDKTYQ